MKLYTLQFKTLDDFKQNLEKLIALINQTTTDSLVLAPELCLNGYAYDRLDDAVSITQKAIPLLKELSTKRIISLTMTTKINEEYFNTLHIFYQGKIVHTQSKVQLFVLNDEKKYFTAGDEEDIKIIEINGIKIASVICFELRFVELWQKLQGADIILIPAMWGKPRKENLETLTQALAVINQCYVCVANSSNEDMAGSSGIIEPFGSTIRDDSEEILEDTFDSKQIKKMRKYMNIGLK